MKMQSPNNPMRVAVSAFLAGLLAVGLASGCASGDSTNEAIKARSLSASPPSTEDAELVAAKATCADLSGRVAEADYSSAVVDSWVADESSVQSIAAEHCPEAASRLQDLVDARAAAGAAEEQRKAEEEAAAAAAAQAEADRQAAEAAAEAERQAAAARAEADRQAAEAATVARADADRRAAEATAEANRRAAAERAESERQAYVAPPSGGGSSHYANCTEARAAGVTPLYAGEPGYARKLDRDGDGVACE